MKTLNRKPTLEVLEDRLVPAEVIINGMIYLVARAPAAPPTQLITSYSLKLEDVFVTSVRAGSAADDRSAAMNPGAAQTPANNFLPGIETAPWDHLLKAPRGADIMIGEDIPLSSDQGSVLNGDRIGMEPLGFTLTEWLTLNASANNGAEQGNSDTNHFGHEPRGILIGLLLP